MGFPTDKSQWDNPFFKLYLGKSEKVSTQGELVRTKTRNKCKRGVCLWNRCWVEHFAAILTVNTRSKRARNISHGTSGIVFGSLGEFRNSPTTKSYTALFRVVQVFRVHIPRGTTLSEVLLNMRG